MDPLSLLASIAGVVTAGIQVSKAIYDLVSTTRGTPKEVSDVARGVSDLSIVLRELRRALKEGRELYRHKLLRRISSAIRRIGQIHAQIREMIVGVEGFASLKWLFRRAKTMHLLYQVESHKNGINMILHIMTLAVQTRIFLRYCLKLCLVSNGNRKAKIVSLPILDARPIPQSQHSTAAVKMERPKGICCANKPRT